MVLLRLEIYLLEIYSNLKAWSCAHNIQAETTWRDIALSAKIHANLVEKVSLAV